MATLSKTRGRKWTKNKKKGWRNIQNEDIEEFLEGERLEERTGGPLGFAIDEKPASEAPAARLTRKQKWGARELKCYSSIGPSKTAPLARVPRKEPSAPKKKGKEKKEKTKKEIQAEQDRKNSLSGNRKRKRDSRPCQFNYSLWGESSDKANVDEHYQVVTKKRKPNVPAYRYKKPSALPAVEVPHPGASYNPAADHWQELLQQAHEVEVKKEKVAQRLHRALDGKFPTLDQAPTEKTWLSEMSGGLFEGAEEEEDTEVVLFDDPDRLSVSKPVSRDRAKLSKQHKRKHQLKLEKEKADKEKMEKAKLMDIRHRLKDIVSGLDEAEKKQETRAQEKAKKEEEAKFKTKRLGSMKFETPDVELQLSDELVGSLRELKPEGNLMSDRFNSLIKRNVIEPRDRANRKRKYKLKTFERKGHKEIKS